MYSFATCFFIAENQAFKTFIKKTLQNVFPIGNYCYICNVIKIKGYENN